MNLNITIYQPSTIYIAKYGTSLYHGGEVANLTNNGWTLASIGKVHTSWSGFDILEKRITGNGPTTITLGPVTGHFIGVIFVRGMVTLE